MSKVFIPNALRGADPIAWHKLMRANPTQRQVNYWLKRNGLGHMCVGERDSRHEEARKRDDSRQLRDVGQWSMSNATGPTTYHCDDERRARIMRNPKFQ